MTERARWPSPEARRPVTRFTLVLLILTSITLFTLDFRGFGPLELGAQRGARSAFAPVGDFASDTLFRPVGDVVERRVRLRRPEERERRRCAPASTSSRARSRAARSPSRAYQQLLDQVDMPFVGDIPTGRARGGVGRGRQLRRHHRDRQGRATPASRRAWPWSPVAASSARGAGHVRTGPSCELMTDGCVHRRRSASVRYERRWARPGGLADGVRLTATTDAGRIVLPGQILVTERLARSRFPQGLPVGTVTNVQPNDGSLDQTPRRQTAGRPVGPDLRQRRALGAHRPMKVDVKSAARITSCCSRPRCSQRGLFSQLRVAGRLRRRLAADRHLGRHDARPRARRHRRLLRRAHPRPAGADAARSFGARLLPGRLRMGRLAGHGAAGEPVAGRSCWFAASSAAAIALYVVVAEVLGQSNAISSAFARDRCWSSPSATPSCIRSLDRVVSWSWPVEPSLRAALR